MEYTNKMYGLIPPNIYLLSSKFPVEYGYYGKRFNNLKFCLELYAAQNRCTIFCNGGEKISLNASIEYYRLFRCAYGYFYHGDISMREPLSYSNVIHSKYCKNIR